MGQGRDRHALEAGTRNLLLGCVGLAAGEKLLVVREDSRHGYYDDAAPDFVADAARRLGARVDTVSAPLIDGPEAFPDKLKSAMAAVDHTLFFGRIGDQVRFLPLPGSGTKTMCYALDAGFLGSAFCRLPHDLMEDLKHRLEAELAAAGEWRITCSLGTDVTGRVAEAAADEAGDDFSLRLFPVVTFRPESCRTMTGRVAVAHWLMATGSRAYEPDALPLDAPVFAVVEDGRIRGFEGDPALVRRVDAHYDMVAAKFDLDRDVVHSWHAGINPQSFYPRPAAEDLERWGGVSFASPRYLHFHTCGNYAPGEIAWSLFDATVEIDGRAYWRDGRLVWLERSEIRALIARYAGGDALFDMRRDIGI